MQKTIETFDLKQLTFNQDNLIPVIVQDIRSKAVLMMAYMNKEALQKTLDTKEATYFSRSRQTLWKKGQTSGNTQSVEALSYDCDADALLMQVKQRGVACHTNKMSCFHNPIFNEDKTLDPNILFSLYNLIKERKNRPKAGSYTEYLFQEGLDKILKKVGEESSEVIIAAKNQSPEEMTNEISDLLYHLIVLMVNENLEFDEVLNELNERRK